MVFKVQLCCCLTGFVYVVFGRHWSVDLKITENQQFLMSKTLASRYLNKEQQSPLFSPLQLLLIPLNTAKWVRVMREVCHFWAADSTYLDAPWILNGFIEIYWSIAICHAALFFPKATGKKQRQSGCILSLEILFLGSVNIPVAQ